MAVQWYCVLFFVLLLGIMGIECEAAQFEAMQRPSYNFDRNNFDQCCILIGCHQPCFQPFQAFGICALKHKCASADEY